MGQTAPAKTINSARNGSLVDVLEDEKNGKTLEYEAPPQKRLEKGPVSPKSTSFAKRKQTLEEADFPITEKIKKVVIDNPMLNIWSIKKILKSERFGFTDIGVFILRKHLKKMGLDSKAKRYRFYRSR